MVSYWDYTLNKYLKNGEEKYMSLDSILSKIVQKEKIFKLNEEYKTIRYIEPEEFNDSIYRYVEPEFNESQSQSNMNPRFILFSAPGATGKTALAKYVSYKRNGIYWDLPDNKIAEYSFQGAITKAVGFGYMSDFVKSLENGKTFLVVDAFDEAEAGSGRSGIEFFLRDLNSVTENSKGICAILLARTESAIFIKKYFETNHIAYKHYEVGYFAEYNSKSYIKNRLDRDHIEITSVVEACINEQFAEVHRIFDQQNAKAFLGYAPVLDALAASYSEERNTTILLKNTASGEKNCELVMHILDHLMEREREKFIKALNNKFSEFNIEIKTEHVYERTEQLNRIIGKMLFDDITIFGEIDSAIPISYHDEYLEVVNSQLPQHPFIFSKEMGSELIYEFSGPAFRDYTIAYGLSNEEVHDFVSDYIVENRKYCPSQLLIEFYEIFSNKNISGRDIPIMYNSFKAHSHLEDEVELSICGEEEDCYAEFGLYKNKKSTLKIELAVNNVSDGVYIDQMTNCYIDIEGKVYIGSANREARINNSTILCDELIWGSEQILIEAYSPGECIIGVNNLSILPNVVPRFEIKIDNTSNLKVSAQNINLYHKFIAYKNDDILKSDGNDFNVFANVVRRIFNCMRSHSKDTPARKMDFINNRIIGNSRQKKEILNYLLMKKILFTDEQDWLYKLDTDKISQYSITWNDVKGGDFNSLERLYREYNSK